jgi:hypothetical protein
MSITDRKTEWETIEHHKNLMKHESFDQLKKSLGPVFAAIPQTEHFAFESSTIPALSAPVTEIVFLTPKEGKSKEEVKAAIGTLLAEMNKLKGLHPPIAYGYSLSNENKAAALLGWDSVEVCVTRCNTGRISDISTISQAHQQGVKEEQIVKHLGVLSEVCVLNGSHVVFKKH